VDGGMGIRSSGHGLERETRIINRSVTQSNENLNAIFSMCQFRKAYVHGIALSEKKEEKNHSQIALRA
jgi:hypothetical protein